MSDKNSLPIDRATSDDASAHLTLAELMSVLPTEDPAVFVGLTEECGSDVRSIAARQNGEDMFHMIASFKREEDGDEHQKVMPTVTSPEQARSEREACGQSTAGAPTVKNGRAELESVTPSFQELEPDRDATIQQWMRVPDSQQLSDRMKQVVLAFLSDGTMMFNANIPHGTPFVTHRLTSLDHSGWFHRIPDPSDWMLFDQRSHTAAGDAVSTRARYIAGRDCS